MRLRKLVSAVLAAVMVFVIAIPSYATVNEEAGCGNPVVNVGVLGNAPGGNCSQQGGPSNCINIVRLHGYRCNPTCHSGGYCGGIYQCTTGHVVGNIGQVMGYCHC